MEALIHATVNGHPCVITEYEIGRDFRTVLGYEQIGDPFPCPGCGARHSLEADKWTNCSTRPAYYEDGEAYEEVICGYCARPFHAPMQAKTCHIAGMQHRTIVLRCVELEWFEPLGVKCWVECGKLSDLTGQYILTIFGNHTATLVGYP